MVGSQNQIYVLKKIQLSIQQVLNSKLKPLESLKKHLNKSSFHAENDISKTRVNRFTPATIKQNKEQNKWTLKKI